MDPPPPSKSSSHPSIYTVIIQSVASTIIKRICWSSHWSPVREETLACARAPRHCECMFCIKLWATWIKERALWFRCDWLAMGKKDGYEFYGYGRAFGVWVWWTPNKRRSHIVHRLRYDYIYSRDLPGIYDISQPISIPHSRLETHIHPLHISKIHIYKHWDKNNSDLRLRNSTVGNYW